MKIRLRTRTGTPGEASIDASGILTIACNGCQQVPDAGSPVCIRCITAAIASEGVADRIQLRAGKDTEISGDAAEILCDLAEMDRHPVSGSGSRRCRNCQKSPAAVMECAWTDFPEPNFPFARSRLHSDRGDLPECASCMQRTGSAITMAEDSFSGVKQKASQKASGRAVL